VRLPASGGRMSASVNRNLGESPARLLLHTDDVDMVCVIHFLGGGIEIPFCCSLVGAGLRAEVPPSFLLHLTLVVYVDVTPLLKSVVMYTYHRASTQS
jgi:hypothetical protein